MEILLSSRGDYVVRAAIALGRAYDTGNLRKIREVSEEMELPEKYAPQILGDLVRAGLAEARAGRSGGYRLLRPPSEITLREVVEAGEGLIVPQHCTIRGGPCEWDDMCPLHPAWDEATAVLRTQLDQSTLAEVLQVDSGLRRGTQRIAPNSHRKQAEDGAAAAG